MFVFCCHLLWGRVFISAGKWEMRSAWGRQFSVQVGNPAWEILKQELYNEHATSQILCMNNNSKGFLHEEFMHMPLVSLFSCFLFQVIVWWTRKNLKSWTTQTVFESWLSLLLKPWANDLTSWKISFLFFKMRYCPF